MPNFGARCWPTLLRARINDLFFSISQPRFVCQLPKSRRAQRRPPRLSEDGLRLSRSRLRPPPRPPPPRLRPPPSALTCRAQYLPLRSSYSSTKETRSPSWTLPSPSRRPVTWQKRSSPPLSGLMKPKPFSFQRSNSPVPGPPLRGSGLLLSSRPLPRLPPPPPRRLRLSSRRRPPPRPRLRLLSRPRPPPVERTLAARSFPARSSKST
mmetsp:Transcript_15067/g.27643  ORF Transcript_15067/g.27643 Transcript_15067/m.27643 type:complete len:209 (+) Transcript_15067:115-741(+)